MSDNDQIDIFDIDKPKTTKKLKKKSKRAIDIDAIPRGNIFEHPVEEVLHNSMLPYSEFVIMDRALPRVEDGLKPVQRRILYTMLGLGNTPDKPHKKSARIVGDCLGKYHPHGDRSVYDAMVRMAQSFSMSKILVEGHGNFGSIDGDSAAAMRYTEVRLSPLALELMTDLDKDTVPFSLNFDDTRKEPDYFPGKFPNLLVNGASGIAVGLATSIPPHNLEEVINAVVKYIDEPDCTLASLLKCIKGPDFPSGGIMQKGQEMFDAYATGKGKVQLRAKFNIEDLPNGKTAIIITELPYQVNKSDFQREVLAVKDKHKGCLNFIISIDDESTKDVRVVITLKKDADADSIIAMLLKYTQMQISFSFNVVAIAGGKPKQLGLVEIIKYYVDFQVEIVRRRATYDLDRAKARMHIVEGLIIAIQNIDEVIKIIKKSSGVLSAKASLIEKFALSEEQAVAILDMRLSRLTNLETNKLVDELKELKIKVEYLITLLASYSMQLALVKSEQLAIKDRFPSPRRTEAVHNFDEFVSTPIEQFIENEESMLAVSYDGLRVKNVSIKNMKESEVVFNTPSDINILHRDSIRVHTIDNVLVFTNKGNVYKLRVKDIEQCKLSAKGIALSQVIKCDMGEEIINVFNYSEISPSAELFFFTRLGYIRKCPLSEFDISKNSASAMKLKVGDEVIKVQDNYYLPSALLVTRKGMALNCELGTTPVQKRASMGVIGMALTDDDEVIYAGQISSAEKVLLLTESCKVKRLNMTEIPMSARNRKGVVVSSAEKIAFATAPVLSGELVIQTKDNEIVSTPINKIDVLARAKPYKAVPKLNAKAKISLARVYVF